MLTDEQLLGELDIRFKANKKSLRELHKVMRELKEVNEKLEKSEHLKTQFLSNIKNEFNNPIASILGLSKNMLTMDNIDKDQMTSMIKLIFKEAFSLDFQLTNIFEAAEVEAGEAIPELMTVDVGHVVTSVIESLEHIAERKNLSIDTNIQKDLHFITDSMKIKIILSNIIGNAIEFSGADNKLIITANEIDENLVLSVQDFGIGISQQDIHRIFDRFVQLDTGTTKAHLGHGLGLSVSKALLEILDGTIDVESKPNEGSIFTILIPKKDLGTEVDDFAMDGNEFLFDADETF